LEPIIKSLKPKTVTLIVSYFILLVLTFCYIMVSIIENDEYYSSASIVFSAVLAVSAAAVTVFYTRKIAREKNTLDFQQSFQNDRAYARNMKIVHELSSKYSYKASAYLKRLAQEKHASTREAESIRYVLNTWEKVANAIRHGLFDEDYLYLSHKSTVLRLGVELRSFVRERQLQNISLYTNFNWLVLRWAIRRDSFQEQATKKELKRVYSQLNGIKSGRIRAIDK